MIRVLSSDDIKKVMTELEALGPQAKVLSAYGLNSRHWVWVQLPEEKTKKLKDGK